MKIPRIKSHQGWYRTSVAHLAHFYGACVSLALHIHTIGKWLLLLGVVMSCDDRFEFLEDVNASPELTIWNEKQNSADRTVLTDAVKISLKHNNLPYYIQIAASDRETNITSINYRFITGNGTLWRGQQELDGKVELAAGQATVEFKPVDVGKIVIEFYVEDEFEIMVAAKADLNVFANLPPVSSFTADFKGTTGPYEYLLDASASYDQDAGQGGGIQAYHFIINDTYEITSKTPVVRYNFPGPGPDRREVRLEVIDTDGDHSDFFPLVVK